MPNFLDLPREVRDIVYADALYTEHVLLAMNEELCDYEIEHEGRRFPKSSISLPLLLVNRQLYAEAMPVLCSINKFEISAYPARRLPSVFTKYGKFFQKIIIYLAYDGDSDHFPEEDVHVSGGDLVQRWKKQIQSLAPMRNLQFLELNVEAMMWWIWQNRNVSKSHATSCACRALKPDLYTSLSETVRKKRGSKHRGIWITGHLFGGGMKELFLLGRVWPGLGLNFIMEEIGQYDPPEYDTSGMWWVSPWGDLCEERDSVRQFYAELETEIQIKRKHGSVLLREPLFLH